uniref:Autophagy-related protein 2 n=1 Tax=Angiostrongylus cantonensis TaxID=6313 RepID=A0A0K0DLU9_ANGCA
MTSTEFSSSNTSGKPGITWKRLAAPVVVFNAIGASSCPQNALSSQLHKPDRNSSEISSSSIGVTGVIMGAIRKTSDAFVNTFSSTSGTGHTDQANIAAGTTNEMPSDEQQKERRMSDIDHLWESARRINGY